LGVLFDKAMDDKMKKQHSLPAAMWKAIAAVAVQSFLFGYLFGCLNPCLVTGSGSYPCCHAFHFVPVDLEYCGM
jgi:hypothetical protein